MAPPSKRGLSFVLSNRFLCEHASIRSARLLALVRLPACSLFLNPSLGAAAPGRLALRLQDGLGVPLRSLGVRKDPRTPALAGNDRVSHSRRHRVKNFPVMLFAVCSPL